MLVSVRRIVTHTDEGGRSYALIDSVATKIIGTLAELWTTGAAPHDHKTVEDTGASSRTLGPAAPNGTVFRFFEIPPESASAHLSREEKQKARSELFEGVGASDCQPDVQVCTRRPRRTIS